MYKIQSKANDYLKIHNDIKNQKTLKGSFDFEFEMKTLNVLTNKTAQSLSFVSSYFLETCRRSFH